MTEEELLRLKKDYIRMVLTKEGMDEVSEDKVAYEAVLSSITEDMINSIAIISMKKKRFVIKKDDIEKFQKGWIDALSKIGETVEGEVVFYIKAGKYGEVVVE